MNETRCHPTTWGATVRAEGKFRENRTLNLGPILSTTISPIIRYLNPKPFPGFSWSPRFREAVGLRLISGLHLVTHDKFEWDSGFELPS